MANTPYAVLYEDTMGRIATLEDEMGSHLLAITLFCPCEGKLAKCCKGRGYHRLLLDCEDNWAEVETMATRSRGVPRKMAQYAKDRRNLGLVKEVQIAPEHT